MYFADHRWWLWHKDKPEYKSFAGERCTVFTTGMLVDNPDVNMLRNLGHAGMSDDQEGIKTGSNSGHQAINVAALTGAARIVLVGYDAKSSGGKDHFFGDHPDRTKPPYAVMIDELKNARRWFIEKKIEVINATPNSALNMFPKMSLEDALA